jgi:hypothetical protein
MTLWRKGYVASMWTYETINGRPTLSIHQHELHIISMHQGYPNKTSGDEL